MRLWRSQHRGKLLPGTNGKGIVRFDPPVDLDPGESFIWVEGDEYGYAYPVWWTVLRSIIRRLIGEP